MGKCRDCDYYYTNDTMDGLYICVNYNSEHFGDYTVCCDDECEDCVRRVRDESIRTLHR